MKYLSYPKAKDTSSRTARKKQRNIVFQKNRKLKAYANRDKRKGVQPC